MRRRFLLSLPLVASVLVLSLPVAAQAQDAWVGTWKINLAKSKYEPANLTLKSQTTKIEAVANGMKTTADIVDASGKVMHQEATATFDGKPAAVTDAPDPNTTRVYKRIDNRTYEFVTSVAGKVTTTTRSVTSADGRTRTNTTTGKNAQGVTVNNVVVFDKQ